MFKKAYKMLVFVTVALISEAGLCIRNIVGSNLAITEKHLQQK
jgi:hypothetical protein